MAATTAEAPEGFKLLCEGSAAIMYEHDAAKGDKGEPADAGGVSDEMASAVRGLQAQVAQLQAAVAESAAGDAEVGLGLRCVWTCLAPEHML